MTTASMTTTSEKNTLSMTTTSSTTTTSTTRRGSMTMDERSQEADQVGQEVSSSDAKRDSNMSELPSSPPAMDSPPVDSQTHVIQLPAADNKKKSESVAAVLPVTIVEVGDSDDSSSSKSFHSATAADATTCTGIMTAGTEARIRRRSLCSLPGRFFAFIVSVIRVIVIIVQNLYHVPTYLFFNWVFFYPIYFFHPSLFNSIENFLYNICLYTVGSWSWSGNIQVIECGDDLYRIRNTPTGVAYGSNGNNNCHLSNSQANQNSNHQLNHHNSVNHMMNQTCKDFASNDRVSTLIEIPSSPEKTNTSQAKNDVPSKDPGFNPNRKFNRHESSEWSEKGCESKGRILLLANHQSTCDVPLMFQALASRAKYVLLWVMDFQFKYSHFGLVSCTHGDYFITPKTFVKNELTKHCLSNPDKDLIILFPEGMCSCSLNSLSLFFTQTHLSHSTRQQEAFGTKDCNRVRVMRRKKAGRCFNT